MIAKLFDVTGRNILFEDEYASALIDANGMAQYCVAWRLTESLDVTMSFYEGMSFDERGVFLRYVATR